MSSITNHQGNANQNLNEISPLICQNGWLVPERQQVTSIGRDVMRREPSGTAVIGTATMEDNMRFLKKLKIELPYDPANPLLGIYSKKNEKADSKRYMGPTLIAALLIILKNRE